MRLFGKTYHNLKQTTKSISDTASLYVDSCVIFAAYFCFFCVFVASFASLHWKIAALFSSM